LMLRKRLFCNTKQPLLPRKTHCFEKQNNGFRNILTTRLLSNSHAYEKYLQSYNGFLLHTRVLLNQATTYIA
jgi:hypothetical protein